MKVPGLSRIVPIAFGATILYLTIGNFTADVLVEGTGAKNESHAAFAAAAAPFRGDVRAELALIEGDRALAITDRAKALPLNDETQWRAAAALRRAPLDARVWLQLARLQGQKNANDPQIVDTLKMSYFTAPGDRPDLLAQRLRTAMTSNALSDEDLKQLVQGDLRLLLTRHRNQIPSLQAAYRSSTPATRSFVRDTARAIDPVAAATLLLE